VLSKPFRGKRGSHVKTFRIGARANRKSDWPLSCLVNGQMLPSSHFEAINLSQTDATLECWLRDGAGRPALDALPNRDCNSIDGAECQKRSAAMLAGEFSEFILASSRLENSYRALQSEVSALGLELSERNAALQASLKSNERMRLELQQIVDSMPCGVLVVDSNGMLSMVNPESRRLLALNDHCLDENSNTTLRQISERSGINLEASYRTVSSEEAEQEFSVDAASGKRWLGVRSRRLFQTCSQGGAHHTILILREITARKRAEIEREAGRRAMALAETATILAHEIRNPLAGLELFAELIETNGERRDEWISNLRAGIRSLSGTVNNVLSFHGSGALMLAPVLLSDLISNAIQFARPLADQAIVSLDWAFVDKPFRVMGNKSALHQVVLNLISNAIRYTPAGGRIRVSIRSEPNPIEIEGRLDTHSRVVAEFSDNGCGIRPDQIGLIFEPGFSGNGDTSGLGLAVCQRIMIQHGGEIHASNRIPSGARFTLHFPELPMELVTA